MRSLENEWPRIWKFLEVRADGEIWDDLTSWLHIEMKLDPEQRAAAHDEWADFFEWELAQREKSAWATRSTEELVTLLRQAAERTRKRHGTTGSASSKIAPASSAL